MIGTIFTDGVTTFKRKALVRTVLLFLDNAGPHTAGTYNNVKLVLLYASCTSVLQSLDQGIIKMLTVHCKTHQKRYYPGYLSLDTHRHGRNQDINCEEMFSKMAHFGNHRR